ncbi:MAG: hypothetical protein IJQ81_08665 [Oscillibacter sp.]|nr:hypothetical protein [Oscillibacter sp.]
MTLLREWQKKQTEDRLLAGCEWTGWKNEKERQSALVFTNAASYSSEQGKPGSVTATGKNGAAGGLIGAILDDKSGSAIENCAAAHKVKAADKLAAESGETDDGGIAGGLLGKVSGSVGVKFSYAGGVTTNGGQYEHEKVNGKDTLIGNVQGAYAGGLIGQAAEESAVTLNNAYSAASVHGSKAADNVYTAASASANVKTEGVVYGAGEYQKGTDGFKTGETKDKPETGSVATGAKPYDAKLDNAYPYQSVQDMGASGSQEWIQNHVGDWPAIPKLKPEIELHNDEILYVDVFLDPYIYSDVPCEYSKVNLEIAGPNGSSVTIPFPFDPATGEFKSGYSFDPETGELKEDPSAPQRVFPVTNDNGKLCYRVILDDVTQENLGFGDLKPNDPDKPIPLGSQIEVKAHAESLDGRSGDSDPAECNSLFADNPTDPSSPTNAHITNFRHLENLNKLNDPTKPIKATLDNDICWTSDNPADNPFKEGVKEILGEYPGDVSDPVYTPVSLNNTTFDGGGNTIKNLEVTNPDEDGNAGVFGTLKGDNTIENLKLEDVSVTAPGAKEAGALIGHSEDSLTVKYVESHSDGPITATDYAGGLIGYAEGDVSVIASASYSDDGATSGKDGKPGSVTATGKDGVAGGLIGGLKDTSGESKVEGCAAANVVTANGENGAAGGLIGQAGGDVDVKFSYAGGATTEDGASVHGGAYAGGLIGHSDGPDVTIDKSYSSATVDGKQTGGLYTGDADVSDSYGVTGLKPREDSDKSAPGKPYNHELLDEENPGSVEYPYRSLGNIIADDGADNLPEWLKDAPAIPEWITNHVGDWPQSNGLPAVIWGADGVDTVSVNGDKFYTVKNDSVRYAWIDLNECDLANQPYITLSVSNLKGASNEEVTETTKLYTFEILDNKVVNTFEVQDDEVVKMVDGAPNAAYTTIGPDGTAGGTGKWLRVTLDDITEKGQRFSDLFPDLNPAQEIRIHAKASEEKDALTVNDLLKDGQTPTRWDGTEEKAPKPNIASPLYDIAKSNGTEAGVTNIRHLQNLDTSVSDAGTVGAGITSAKLFKDLNWNDGYWNTKSIYVGDKGGSTNKSFYGIENEKLTSFDGQDHTLSNFVIDRTSDNIPGGSKDAGLFRTLTGDARNLNLEGFTVKAGSGGDAGVLAANTENNRSNGAPLQVENIFINTNHASVMAENYAGGLIGCAEGPIDVKTCASYSKGFANESGDGSPGSVEATGANGVAGGLIGAIKGAGGSTVENCAAANKVTANGADGVAGGLIGQASGTVGVSSSYAGGVTTNGGQYERTNNALDGNVQGAYAGGLIGQAEDKSAVTLNNAYSAASVHGSKAADNVYTTSGSADVKTEGVVYGAGEYQQGNGPVRTGTPERLTNPTNPTTGGKPYDAKLLDNENPDDTSYPYKGLRDMGVSGGQEWIQNHVGDWPVIPNLDPKITLHNEEILYVDVFLDDCAYSTAGLEIKGPNGTSVTIPFPFDPNTGEFKAGFTFDPATGEWKEDPSAPQRVFPKTDASGNLIRDKDGKISYRVILDDVTQDKLGFDDIPSNDPKNPKNPIPLGSQIEVQAHVKSLDGRTGDSNIEKCNSLFADNATDPSSPTNAHITNFRHLENLNKLNDPSTPVKATLDNDICWTSSDPSDNPFKEGVKQIRERDGYSIPSSDPVYTPVSLNNTTFNGGNHAIQNLEVTKADKDGNAGVFGTLTGTNAIEKLKLEDVSVTAPDAKEAGALIGHSEGSLTVKHVESHSDGPITATDYAGGLIGHAKGDVSVIASASYSENGAASGENGTAGSVTATGRKGVDGADDVDGVSGGLIGRLEDTSGNSKVEGCAAANVVEAKGGNSVAGGLIGQADGTVGVKLSYAGGVTTGDDPASVNGAYAGGLIGQANGTGDGVTIEKSYSSAEAKGSEETGAFSTGNNITVTESYGADNLKPRKPSDKVSQGLPYDKDLLDEDNPNRNPEYPYRTLGNVIGEGGSENLPDWLTDGAPIPEWISNHVGDWPKVPSVGDPPAVIWGTGGTASLDGKHTVLNDDVRYAWIKLQDYDAAKPKTVTLVVSNVLNNVLFLTRESERVTHTFTIATDKSVTTAGGLKAEYRSTGPDGDIGDWLRVVLDDITTPGQRFYDLFPTLNPALEVRVRAGNDDRTSAVRWTGTDASAFKPNVA